MKKNIKQLYIICLVLGICLVYIGIRYYNSDDVQFNRYLSKIASIERADVMAIQVSLSKDDTVFKSYFDEEKSYLMLELLHGIKELKQEPVIDNEMDYSYGIWNAIETSKSLYAIRLEVNEINYNIKIMEISIDINNNKKITVNRYFKSNDKSTALLKELINVQN